LKRLMVFVSSILSPSPKPMAAMPSELFCFTNNFKCSLSAPRFYRNQYLLYFCQKKPASCLMAQKAQTVH
jgi:hypothetical protein